MSVTAISDDDFLRLARRRLMASAEIYFLPASEQWLAECPEDPLRYWAVSGSMAEAMGDLGDVVERDLIGKIRLQREGVSS